MYLSYLQKTIKYVLYYTLLVQSILYNLYIFVSLKLTKIYPLGLHKIGHDLKMSDK